MKLITKDTDYAIMALCYIAKHSTRVVSVSELVRNLRIPRAFLRKILQILNNKGFLKSYRGKGGGFVSALPPHKVFLVDLIETFQGPLILSDCFFKKGICPEIKICTLKKKIDTVEKDIVTALKSITIQSLL